LLCDHPADFIRLNYINWPDRGTVNSA
jgi:hypothetical protein